MGFSDKNTGVGAVPFSRGSSRPRDQTCASCTGRKILYHWATREARRSFLEYYKSKAQNSPWLLWFYLGESFSYETLFLREFFSVYVLNDYIHEKDILNHNRGKEEKSGRAVCITLMISKHTIPTLQNLPQWNFSNIHMKMSTLKWDSKIKENFYIGMKWYPRNYD